MTDDIALAILAELKAQTALLRRQHADAENRAALVEAVRAALGPGRFTLRGLLELAPDEPALAEALAPLVDISSAPGAAIALQKRVKHWSEFRPVDMQRGVTVYELRD